MAAETVCVAVVLSADGVMDGAGLQPVSDSRRIKAGRIKHVVFLIISSSDQAWPYRPAVQRVGWVEDHDPKPNRSDSTPRHLLHK